MFLKKYGSAECFAELEQEINKLNLQKECCYAFKNTSLIYPSILDMSGYQDFLERIKPTDTAFLKQIYWPKTRKLFEYAMDFEDWIFCQNKAGHLREISQ